MPTMDGVAVHCAVYLDGKKIGLYHDAGNGGEANFQIHPYTPANKEAVKKLEEYAASLDKTDLNADKELGDKPMMFQPDFNWLVDQAINDYLYVQCNKKFEKQKKVGIVYGTGESYYGTAYWKKLTLEKMLHKPNGANIVQAKIDDIKKKLKAGERILNSEYLQSLGWKV